MTDLLALLLGVIAREQLLTAAQQGLLLALNVGHLALIDHGRH